MMAQLFGNTPLKKKQVSVAKDGLNEIIFARKSDTWGEVDGYKVQLSKLSDDLRKKIQALPQASANPKTPVDDYSNNPKTLHVLNRGGKKYLVDPSGYSYARYAAHLID